MRERSVFPAVERRRNVACRTSLLKLLGLSIGEHQAVGNKIRGPLKTFGLVGDCFAGCAQIPITFVLDVATCNEIGRTRSLSVSA